MNPDSLKTENIRINERMNGAGKPIRVIEAERVKKAIDEILNFGEKNITVESWSVMLKEKLGLE
jgi:hypothetical protein